jgi:hypothetical protein
MLRSAMLRSALTAALLFPLAVPVVAAEPDPLLAQRSTIHTMRGVGNAMFRYVAAETLAGRAPSAGRSADDTASAAQRIDWSNCPAVTHEEAAALLAPYVEPGALPRVDGWGHELTLCVRREGSGPVIGIRSAGADGKFEGDVYEVGAFDPDDQDRDVVWLDGYFVRWPQRDE